ncbi:hypothetical protein PIB30_108488, partial [Stylosanthes scabra]|nr:hypothetical protein [Stylosanthes scabra]
MGDLLGSPRVAPLFQYLFFTRPSGRRPSSRKLGSVGSGIRCPRRRAYDDCVRIHWQ